MYLCKDRKIRAIYKNFNENCLYKLHKFVTWPAMQYRDYRDVYVYLPIHIREHCGSLIFIVNIYVSGGNKRWQNINFLLLKRARLLFLGLLIEAYCCAMDNRVNRFGAARQQTAEYRSNQWINVNCNHLVWVWIRLIRCKWIVLTVFLLNLCFMLQVMLLNTICLRLLLKLRFVFVNYKCLLI